jgi:hypothetical protein
MCDAARRFPVGPNHRDEAWLPTRIRDHTDWMHALAYNDSVAMIDDR